MASIDIHLRDPSQLFQTADPFPFHENGLEPDAERYFLRKAEEAGRRTKLRITLHLNAPGHGLAERLRTAFATAAEDERRAMGDLFRTGRRSLAIGLCVLGICLLVAARVETLVKDYVTAGLARESAIVFGWVAIWRPAEIFLYDWLPFRTRLQAWRRLAAAEITVDSAG